MPHQDLYTTQPTQIVFYSTTWCPDCRRARAVLERLGCPFMDVNIDHDRLAEAFVKHINRGNRSVPTIVFPDGAVLVEPASQQLAEKIQPLHT